MRVLIVKTSSMGDVLHTLPSLTDAMRAIPGIRFDWVVEEGFAQIPPWHECGASMSRARTASSTRCFLSITNSCTVSSTITLILVLPSGI